MARRMGRSGARALATIGALAASLIAACHRPVLPIDRAPGDVRLPLSGSYLATVHSRLFGSMQGRLVAEPTEGGFIANSRPGVAWEFIGGLEALVGPLLLPDLFPGGVIWSWVSDLPPVGGSATGEIGPGRFLTATSVLRAADEPVEILLGDRRVALLTIDVDRGDGAAMRDYEAVVDRLELVLRDEFYDPRQLETWAFRRYMELLRRASEQARDDIEFAFAAEMAKRRTIRASQLGLLRSVDPAIAPLLGDGSDDELVSISASDGEGRVETLRAIWFESPERVDAAMREIIARRPRGVIIDLRRCYGGNFAATRVLAHLVDTPMEVGVLVGPRAIATSPDVASLPRAAIDDLGPDVDLQRLDALGSAVVFTVEPAGVVYDGPVAVLTSERTVSVGELVADVLQRSGRARVFGERSAGKLLGSARFDLGEGWVVQVPVRAMQRLDGTTVDGRGVVPDEPGPSRRADEAAIRWIDSLPQRDGATASTW